jgi:hypothetical protein
MRPILLTTGMSTAADCSGPCSARSLLSSTKTRHVQADDAGPLKRPFTPVELQQFFDLADLEPERILYSGRKGALAAWRDAVAFKTLYGWGLFSRVRSPCASVVL